jgi:crotonobetainyl-CoA:carnitine CoA-transferase CaiB-like acyl-CoA transferase
MSTGMLAGHLVIECGDERVEFAGKLLAQMGATVVKVEPPGGALTRQATPRQPTPDGGQRSFHFMTWNVGKQSVELDLTAAPGRAILGRLLDRADVVLVGADQSDSAGLDPVTARDGRERLVHVDVSPFGRSGPYAGYQGTDDVVFALSGYMYISGQPGRPPLAPPGRQSFVIAGSQAALATVIALRQRRATGSGQAIEIAAIEVVAAQENLYSTYSSRQLLLTRNGSQHRACVPGRIFPCLDGHIHIYVGAQKERGVWDRWLEWTGRPTELADPEFQSIAVRKQPENLALIDGLATRFFADKTRAELVAEGQRRHIPVVPVLTPAEALVHPHLIERSSFARVGDEAHETVLVPQPPWRTPEAHTRLAPAPLLDEHEPTTAETLCREDPS